ncbi:hypothetical protein ACOZ4Y_07980 [Komagataeibacter rhaeticus]|uniref:hypothetical protein n=1 Tax=Komagataeibacter rhaeticus TaxID=215221 RepID=UPI0004D396FD|nr:hypothetical protein [Komagataeibacter rhaeticus]KDU96493.1 hypothetical protein GLUCORHAEAF1_01285 [Komagataeibacter rhaeticus AF1]GBQ17047.1 hypothetical protein AA16663_2583 [Komagataeibacter rhaeticus DSM 16663]
MPDDGTPSSSRLSGRGAPQVGGGQMADSIHDFGGGVPMGRAGQPAERAPVYVLLAASEAGHVTGQVCAASGGTGVG